jgi:hypothetical protein
MRLSAYVMLSDPAFIEASILSYYDIVDRIFLSYDVDGIGWGGRPVAVDECLKKARRIDHSSKMVELPGHFADPTRSPLECDTNQRRIALGRASEGADWVLQLDSDEVLGSKETLLGCLDRAIASGAQALDYPSRWFFTSTKHGLAERCSRLWRVSAGYPGAIAVQSGTVLSLCRQTTAQMFRVDFRPKNTDRWQSGTHVDMVISPKNGVFHFSWVRTPEAMQEKRMISSHSREDFWDDRLAYWTFVQRHPFYVQATVPLRGRENRYRLTPISKTPLTHDVNLALEGGTAE